MIEGGFGFKKASHYLVWLLCLPLLSPQSVATDISFSKAFENLANEVNSAAYLPPQLDFAQWLQQQRNLDSVQLDVIANWQYKLTQLNPSAGCEQLQRDQLRMRLNILENRSRLLSTTSQITPLSYQGNMSLLPNAKTWYLHWLNSWLLLDAEKPLTNQHIEMLKSMAQKELTQAHTKLQALTSALPINGLKSFGVDDKKAILGEFALRHQTVMTNLSRVLGKLANVPNVVIEQSSLPESFPAPGIYNAQNQTFYYHFTNRTLLGESLDWLYLHEAFPGHHLQASILNTAPLCPNNNMLPPLVMAEGWAAYVETLGEELGLFNHPNSLHYVYQWRVLRALRVLIDIGIHYDGWQDQQALTLWQLYLPEQMSIGRRELNRIKNWPVQAISYVYGKHHIEQLIEQIKYRGYSGDESNIRNVVLRLTNFAPLSLTTVSHFLQKEFSNNE